MTAPTGVDIVRLLNGHTVRLRSKEIDIDTEFAAFTVTDVDGIAVLTLSRAESLNALRSVDVQELTAWFRAASLRRDLRAIVITGAGRAFCAGMDMKSGLGADAPTSAESRIAPGRWILGLLGELIRTMRATPQLVVAAVNGPTVGAGLAIALAADFRMASDNAFFVNGFLGVGGQGAEAGVSYMLPRICSQPLAARLLFTQERISAEEALSGGLVYRVHEAGDLVTTAVAFAQSVLATSTYDGLALTKSAYSASLESGSFASTLELETRGQMMLG